MTTESDLAKAFYSKVIGWSTRDASAPGMPYTIFTLEDTSIGALTDLPENARRMGAEPRWVGYIGVNDVDAAVSLTKKLGGNVHAPPVHVTDVGRISLIADPQMATFAVVKGFGSAQHHCAVDEPGGVGWHELLASDAEKAFAFYSELFGWQKAEATTDPMGTYQQFSIGGQTIGGMFTKPAMVPLPFWLYYFNVGGINAAAQRVIDVGGQILEGPVDLPGGSSVARCADPQGAMFALIEKRKDKTPGYFERASHNPTSTPARRWSW
jgi:predicted enzyme related to lactoylglutathione lyase